MPACRVGLLVAALLLGLLLLGFPPVTSTGVEKTGVCPELKEDLNCTQECGSDGECADNLKCCRAGCATVCHLPNEKQGSCPQVDLPLTPLGLCRDQCQCPVSHLSSELQPPQPEEWEGVEVSTWPCRGPAQLPLCFAFALLPPALTTASFANQ
ncbi:WAP four-disulfide core domain 2 [Rhinolophus ferrumequinum]|uniref:WAP four-disulfide core domain protein 2 n=1 Tax=Rhinolophus ferrumequinum TaxID=59479 RepID=A0A7J7S9L7_RHIFE|nr:WAP four-disulfide core domain 2 [Rhinolophus ferrumequinum]